MGEGILYTMHRQGMIGYDINMVMKEYKQVGKKVEK